jgi:hypothetical protein
MAQMKNFRDTDCAGIIFPVQARVLEHISWVPVSLCNNFAGR